MPSVTAACACTMKMWPSCMPLFRLARPYISTDRATHTEVNAMMRATRFGIAVLTLCACAPAEEAKPVDADPAIAAIQARIDADTANWQHYVSLSNELRHKNRLEEAAQAAEKAF